MVDHMKTTISEDFVSIPVGMCRAYAKRYIGTEHDGVSKIQGHKDGKQASRYKQNKLSTPASTISLRWPYRVLNRGTRNERNQRA